MSVSEGRQLSQAGISSTRIILIGVALILLMGSLSSSIVTTALPQIAQALDGVDYLTWVVTAYLLSSTCAAPICGRIGDIFGRRKVLLVAVGLFLLGSIMSAVSPTILLLVVSRFVQGLGGGAMMIISQTVIADVVPSAERAKIQGYLSVVFTTSAIAGPFVGGVIVQFLTWHWVFLINIPVALIALTIVARHVPSRPSKDAVQIDYTGAALLSSALSLLILLTSLLGSNGLSWLGLSGFVAAILALTITFIWVERKVSSPILPLGLFSIRNFSSINANSFLVGAAMYAEIIFLPVYVQVVRGGTALETGFLMLPMMLGMMATSTLSGFIMSYSGRYKALFIVSGVVMTAGFYGLTHLEPDTNVFVAVVLMLVVGIGMGPIMSITVPAIQDSVPSASLGVATASVSMFRQIGGSVGASIFGMVFAAALSGVAGETVRAGAQALSTTDVSAMTAAQASIYRQSVNGAIQVVFHIAWLVSALSLLAAIMMARIAIACSFRPSRQSYLD